VRLEEDGRVEEHAGFGEGTLEEDCIVLKFEAGYDVMSTAGQQWWMALQVGGSQ
jgi:hypothetical protein